MSTSKHIDVICVVVLLCTLLVTGLFINGTALGIEAITDADAGDGQFTANDRNADWDTTGATRITLTGDGGSVKGNGAYVYDGNVHIIQAGKYMISGELTNGSVIVDADYNDKIWMLLDGVSLHCANNAALLVEQAGKVFLTLADGTENYISSGEDYSHAAVSNKIDGAIFSRDDLTINGSGSLAVTAAYKHGIVGNDDLVITGGHIEITAVQDGIHVHDSVRLTDMDLTINAGDDGITVSNDDETAYLYIESGNINIQSCYEGLEAIDITIIGGVIDSAPRTTRLTPTAGAAIPRSISPAEILQSSMKQDATRTVWIPTAASISVEGTSSSASIPQAARWTAAARTAACARSAAARSSLPAAA